MKRNITILTVLMISLVIGSSAMAGSRAVTIDDDVFISSRSVGRAIQMMQSGDWKEARNELERVLDRNPRNHYALFDLGVWHGRFGDRDLAEDYVQKALDLRFSRYYLEGLSRIRGTLGRGSDLYRRIFRCRGDCGIGNYYARAGLWEEALEHYSESFRYFSRNHVACFHMALAYEALGDRENALVFCERAMKIKQRNTWKYEEFYDRLLAPESPVNETWEVPESNTLEPMEPVDPEYRYVRVDVANLRSAPSTLGRRIQLLHRGSRVEFLKSEAGWVYIRSFHRQEGWIHGDLLSTTAEGAWEVSEPAEVTLDTAFYDMQTPNEQTPEISDQTLIVADRTGDVAVRAEPSVLAEIIYYFKPGESVTMLNKSRSKWVFVRTPVGAGYVLEDFFIQE